MSEVTCDTQLVPGHNQTVTVSCISQFQPSPSPSMVCSNGTWLPANSSSSNSSWSNYSSNNSSSSWSSVAKCVPAKCTELPDAPRNGMVVAPNLDHGMVGKFEVGS